MTTEIKPQDGHGGSTGSQALPVPASASPGMPSLRHRDVACVVELVLDPRADLAQVLAIYRKVREADRAEVLLVEESPKGKTLRIAVRDQRAFLAALAEVPGVLFWNLTLL